MMTKIMSASRGIAQGHSSPPHSLIKEMPWISSDGSPNLTATLPLNRGAHDFPQPDSRAGTALGGAETGRACPQGPGDPLQEDMRMRSETSRR